MQSCPCGTGKLFSECCEPYINEQSFPAKPEELMRSRYTAYSLKNIAYIEKTMKPPANIGFDAAETLNWAKDVTWLKLEIIKTQTEIPHGTVEFIAHYRYLNEPHVLHEKSEFVLENNRWFYVDGKIIKSTRTIKNKIARNEPCDCGSGKKYKRCCGGERN